LDALSADPQAAAGERGLVAVDAQRSPCPEQLLVSGPAHEVAFDRFRELCRRLLVEGALDPGRYRKGGFDVEVHVDQRAGLAARHQVSR
jgi:hypothetical protein